MRGFQLDLNDPALRQKYGLRNSTEIIPKQSRWRREKRPYRSRGDTCDLVKTAVAAAAKPMTRSEIASAVKRSKNPALIGVINELVSSGYLREIQDEWRGVLMLRYEVAS